MNLTERYDSAIRTSNLDSRVNPDATAINESDVLGAFAFAGHRSKHYENGERRDTAPLAVALTRLFCGDNRAATDIVNDLYCKALDKAAALRIDLKRTQAQDIARAVLAWHRDGVCRVCQGHGFDLIPGAPAISANHCQACDGTGKVIFAAQFPTFMRVLAVWLLAEVEREQSRAGPVAMAKLAERM